MLRERAAPLIKKYRLAGDQRPSTVAAEVAAGPEPLQPTLF
jgi:hypothetical protein